MYVYFIRADGKPKRLKIGKATDPAKRLKELQTGCPYPLSIAAQIKCRSDRHALLVEQLAHSYFAAYRTHGEWFKCTDFVLSKAWEFELSSDVAALAGVRGEKGEVLPDGSSVSRMVSGLVWSQPR